MRGPYLVAALAFAAMTCGSADAPAQRERVVNVYNWSDYVEPTVLDAFTKETGIRVRYDTFDSNDTLETKLLAGKSGYDVKKAREILGPGREIDSWNTVFGPGELAKFKDCGVHMLDSSDDILPAALHFLGRDPNSTDPGDLEKAADLVAKVRPAVRKFHSSEYLNGLASGEICLVVGWSGDIKQAQKRAAEAKNGVEIGYVVPKEGAQMFFDNLAIPKDARNAVEAHAFIDYMLRPEVAAKNTDFLSYANGNLASQSLIDPAILNDRTIYPDEATMARLYTINAHDAKTTRLMNRLWTKIKTGR